MNIRAGGSHLRSKREVIDVIEPKKPDRSLDNLISVRKRRLDRYEREKIEARAAWRETRNSLHEKKIAWREALLGANEFWRDARDSFFRINTTSGKFRSAKAAYERMKFDAAKLRMECAESVKLSTSARSDYFSAIQRVREANKEQEKLGILRDEIKLASMKVEE